MAKTKQHGGKLKTGTLIAAGLILAALAVLYFFMKRREGFEGQVTVRYYFLEECGWCKRFNPEWETFVKNLADDAKLNDKLSAVKTEKIDGSTPGVPVQAFPTIHLVGKDGKVEEYKGERTATAIMDAVLKML